jgi:hypothetical protein
MYKQNIIFISHEDKSKTNMVPKNHVIRFNFFQLNLPYLDSVEQSNHLFHH